MALPLHEEGTMDHVLDSRIPLGWIEGLQHFVTTPLGILMNEGDAPLGYGEPPSIAWAFPPKEASRCREWHRLHVAGLLIVQIEHGREGGRQIHQQTTSGRWISPGSIPRGQ
jgi:hypothetical protein